MRSLLDPNTSEVHGSELVELHKLVLGRGCN